MTSITIKKIFEKGPFKNNLDNSITSVECIIGAHISDKEKKVVHFPLNKKYYNLNIICMNVAIYLEERTAIKNKNILKIFSKPMFMYPIHAAKKVKEIEKIYVSSDSKNSLKLKRKMYTNSKTKKFCNDKKPYWRTLFNML